MSSLPRLVGLIGRKGSGKDTAAAVLLDEGYVNVKFAGALKDMIRCVLAYQGVDADTIERMIEGDLKEVPTEYLAGKTPRYAMQTLGTEWGRKLIDEGFWVGATMRRVKTLLGIGHRVVVTDVRFPNEDDEIVDAGGVSVGIQADWTKAVEGEHESEALIDALIARLPQGRRVVNLKAATSKYIKHAIQEFQMRFLATLQTL
jgi:hypothetical protein